MENQIEITSVDQTDEYEGSVWFLINGSEYCAFFYGATYEKGEKVKVNFSHLEYPLDWDVIFTENKNHEIKIEKSYDGLCSYYCYGKIISIHPVIADFGDIKLNLGEWTNDEKVIGEFIYWKIERLDIEKINETTHNNP